MEVLDQKLWDDEIRIELLGVYIIRGIQLAQSSNGQVPDNAPNSPMLFAKIIAICGDKLDDELQKIAAEYNAALAKSIDQHKAEAERQAKLRERL
jgi:hypothetical protein